MGDPVAWTITVFLAALFLGMEIESALRKLEKWLNE